MDTSIVISEKPDWVSWDEISSVLKKSHQVNLKDGIKMALHTHSSDYLREKVEGQGKMFVALDGDKLVGTAALIKKRFKFWFDKEATDYAYVCLDSVLPDYSHHGIFRMLDAQREAAAKDMGLDVMIADTHESHKRRLVTARKSGYIPIDIMVWKDHYNVVIAKWFGKPRASRLKCRIVYGLRKFLKKLRYKPGPVKRFGI